MGTVRRRRQSTGRDEAGQRITSPPDWPALGIFALLVTLAPLAFGAVDQIVQVGLLLLFAGGLALHRPALPPPAARLRVLLLAFVAMLVLKEFLPSALFGGVRWRAELADFALPLPWTHHPEPGRAVDLLVSGGLVALWFLWVRTLAVRRENRTWIAWALAGSATVVAVISFWLRSPDAKAIFGLRYTPGWLGFGPFPNRNHTACFFAMGVIMATGVAVWSSFRKNITQALVATAFALVSLAGLMATQSRGGVVALAAGLALYGGFCLAKFRDRRAVGIIAGIFAIALTVMLVGGSAVFARFSAPTSADSNDSRVAIWGETLRMWSDAPLFGHGAGSFASLFPLYSRLELDNEVILHPESSWLQWLAELGFVPVLLAVVVAAAWGAARVRATFRSHRSFFLYAAGFSTFGALLCHAFIDVPAHRWGTLGFALAALALACPGAKRGGPEETEPVDVRPGPLARRAALVPLFVAILWAMPLLADWPSWSPLTLQRQLAMAEAPGGSSAGLARLLPQFALNSQLHHLYGLSLLRAGAPEDEWRAEFESADRLSPGYWGLPIMQARACVRQSPEAALHFWQLGLTHAGRRAGELFNLAYDETARLPRARESWSVFVSTYPTLALELARHLPRAEAASSFSIWWQERGSNSEIALTEYEVSSFFSLAPTCSNAADFARFTQLRPALISANSFAAARVLHTFGDDLRAWQILNARIHEPPYPKPPPRIPRAEFERRLRLNPDSYPNAQILAASRMSEGDEAGADALVLEYARKPKAPPFFTHKAAHILQRRGEHKEAVEVMLLQPPT